MASIIATSINLNEIPKDKIIVGKKGKYLPITITLNDELDQFGNQGPVVVEQSKEERESTNGQLVDVAPRDDQQMQSSPQQAAPAAAPADDLPF